MGKYLISYAVSKAGAKLINSIEVCQETVLSRTWALGRSTRISGKEIFAIRTDRMRLHRVGIVGEKGYTLKLRLQGKQPNFRRGTVILRKTDHPPSSRD